MAVVAVAGGSAGPVFDRAAGASALVSAVEGAPQQAKVTLEGQGGGQAYARMVAVADHPPGGARVRWWGPLATRVVAGLHVPSVHQGRTFGGLLLARSGLCRHVRFVAGSCPHRFGAVAVSTRVASLLDVRVGSSIPTLVPGTRAGPRLRVVAVYAVPAVSPGGYWSSGAVFASGAPDSSSGPPLIDAFLSSRATALAPAGSGDVPEIAVTRSLVGGRLGDGPLGRLERGLAGYRTRAGKAGLFVVGGLGGLLASVREGDGTATTVIDVAALQLVALGLLVLYLVASVAASDRRSETELAARRGFTRRQLLVVALGEPALLLAAAWPVGLVLAWAAVAGPGRLLLASNVVVGLPVEAIVFAVVVVGAGLVAVGVATSELWRGSARAAERSSRARNRRVGADTAAVALAIAGLAGMSASGALSGARASPVALVAPGLLAIGGGVVGLRLAQAAVRLGVKTSAGSTRLGWFLGLRQLARADPAPLRRALALTAAVVLAVFAVAAWGVAAANRVRVAGVEVGASRVVDVTTAPGADLMELVDRADPGARTAMAAAYLRSQSGNTLAVQADRLAAVASWPLRLGSTPVAEVARRLAPPTVPALRFRADELLLDATVSAGSPRITVSATVFNEAGQDEDTVQFAPIGPGRHSVRAPLEGFCSSTCRLVDLSPTVNGNGPVPSEITFTLDALGVRGPSGPARSLPIHSGRRGSWSAQPTGIGIGTAGAGVRFRIPAGDVESQGTFLAPADFPDPIPAVATTAALSAGVASAGSDTFDATGLDLGSIQVNGTVTVPRLPEAGTNAVLIDLSFAELARSGASQAVEQVWLRGPRAGAVLARLEGLGVRVTSSATEAATVAQLGHGAVAVGYDAVLAAGVLAAALAVGATLYVLVATGRRRLESMHSLLAGGVPVRAIRRAVVVETVIVLGAPLVVGGAVGYIASSLSISSLPQLASVPAGVPLARAVPYGGLLEAVAGMAVVLVATAAAAVVSLVGAEQIAAGRR